MYHKGNRELQDRFGSRALADRLETMIRRDRFTDDDAAFIHAQSFFFLATADGEGRPDCSYKGGAPGFVRVAAPDLLIFPDYDGNGMFKSLGNLAVNPHVGLLFLGVGDAPKRLRVNGRASLCLDDPLMGEFAGAQALVRVTPEDIFPNCPRYIPKLEVVQPSRYAPIAGQPLVEAEWKSMQGFSDVVPPRAKPED